MSTLTVTLAEQIRSELALAEASLRDSFQHYLTVGELLAEEKTRVVHGAWLPWLAENVGISEREAQRYMRLAEHREQLEAANPSGLSDLSIERALKEVAKPKHEPAVDVAGALQGLAADPAELGAGERLDEARDRLQAEASVQWTSQQERKRERALEQLDSARALIDSAGGLSAFAVIEILRDSAIAARHAAAALDELAFSFER